MCLGIELIDICTLVLSSAVLIGRHSRHTAALLSQGGDSCWEEVATTSPSHVTFRLSGERIWRAVIGPTESD